MRPCGLGAFAVAEYRKPEEIKQRTYSQSPFLETDGKPGKYKRGYSLALGSWLAIPSLHPRANLTSLIWE